MGEYAEDFEPVDPVVAAKAAKLEKKLKAKEATVEKLRDEVRVMMLRLDEMGVLTMQSWLLSL